MNSSIWLRRTGLPLYLFFTGAVYSQELLDPAFRLNQTDKAVLESGDFRDELPCRVTSEKAALRFDFAISCRLYRIFSAEEPEICRRAATGTVARHSDR
jgi:hypothetical protein